MENRCFDVHVAAYTTVYAMSCVYVCVYLPAWPEIGIHDCVEIFNSTPIALRLLLYYAMSGTFVSIHGQQIDCSLLKWNVPL